MQLTPSMQDFILHWGEMGARWGLNRSVAQILALLHISPDPLTAEDIATTLNLARSNVSTGLKELQTWRLIRITRQLGDRRDYFTTMSDIFDMVETVIEVRREREFEPTLNALRDIQGQAEQDETPAEVRTRMAETYETLQALDDWYAELSALPRATQLGLIKIGAKIGSIVSEKPKKPKKKKKDRPED